MGKRKLREKKREEKVEKKMPARFNVSTNVPKHSPQGKGEKRVCPCNLYKRTERMKTIGKKPDREMGREERKEEKERRNKEQWKK